MDLDEITLDALPDIQQVALLRLQLMVTGQTHELLLGFLADVRSLLTDAAGPDGTVASEKVGPLATESETLFRAVMEEWTVLLAAARRESVAIPFGSMVVMHNHLAGLVEEPVAEAIEVITAGEPTYEPQLQAVLDAAANRAYGDGFQLSDRVWNLEQSSLQGIRETIHNTLATGQSAYDAAQELEQFLGAGQDCPRWTSTRLYGLTPAERINSERGLFGGSPCESRGVAYKALRLARNEIQIVHHEATRELFRQQPWVQQERIRLSPQHPERDICDEYAEGGPYEIGEVPLPVHIQCLCYPEAVLMKEADFVAQTRGWMRGESSWPAMDTYHEMVGGDRMNRSFNPLNWELGGGLLDWFQAAEGELETRLHRVTNDVIWWVVQRVFS